ncbi:MULTISPECIES: glycoside hydrolase family 3 protein [Clostridia]|uniref:glycoside hydrolase family 3 protein n=1 Tax=Clostridia TaxID=186801 RepID=UPI000EA05BF8|nr:MULTISPECIES: glycoside hydrolase family 3 protein [Clostridia]NBJ71380.1 glycoside hydrolase family 3 protein [Roseburia sp. 1XD42-34]RKI74469.1 glycoside hydrolase family 3 protein [Clostridium sp. 1xD42-85]
MKHRQLLFILSFLIILSILFTVHTLAAEKKGKRDLILSKMRNMTLEEKIGQLFIVHVYGKTPTDTNYEQINLKNDRGGKNFKEVIEKYYIGGVIYFNWTDNIGIPLDAQQLNALSNGLQDIAIDQRSEIPLFISTDQEGGIIQRVASPGTVFPGNMALGATRSARYASETASILGKELRSLGINMNYAPVVDVNMNPANPVIGVRSFGENPHLVSRLGNAQVKGYQEENILASAKHFPGHGDTDVDSHYGLPIINHDLDTLHEVDLKPFKEAINAGIDSIMTAHIVVPALDNSGLPATFSKPILTDLLRKEMNFQGLIITDSLDMSGANVVPQDRVAVEAFKAGADILLNPPNVALAFNSMLEAIENGEINEKRLDESVYRILAAKMENGLFDNPYAAPESVENIGTKEHLQMAEEIANRSITLVKNENNILPLQGTENLFVTGPISAKPDLLMNLLNEHGMEAKGLVTKESPTEDEINKAVKNAQEADVVIVTTYTANTNEAQEQLVHKIEEIGKPLIVAAIRNPYDLMVFPEVDAYLTTYGFQDTSLKALSKAIIGEINPFGQLPVTIPDLYEYGHGLDYIHTPESANGMRELVENLVKEGEVRSNDTARSLDTHLLSVGHYEENHAAEKVVKHLNSFKQMLNDQKDNEMISEKAYHYLMTETDRLIEKWS